MCDRWDIGGLSTNVHFQTGRSTIFIYDGHPGGVGITLRGYEQFERLLDDAERLIAECPCESGLPLLRAEPEVRQPQRTAPQGGSAGADADDEGMDRRRARAIVAVDRGERLPAAGSARRSAAARRGGRSAAGRGGRDRRLRRPRRGDGGGGARCGAGRRRGDRDRPGSLDRRREPPLHPRRRQRDRLCPQPRRRRQRRRRDRGRRRPGGRSRRSVTPGSSTGPWSPCTAGDWSAARKWRGRRG